MNYQGKTAAIMLAGFLIFARPVAAEKPVTYNVLPYAFYDSSIGTMGGLFGAGRNFFQRDELINVYLNLVDSGAKEFNLAGAWPSKELRYDHEKTPLACDAELSVGTAVDDRFYGLGMGTPDKQYSNYNNNYTNLRLFLTKPVSKQLRLGLKLHSSNNQLFKINNQLNPITTGIEDQLRNYQVMSFFLKGEEFDNPLNPSNSWGMMSSIDFGFNSASFVRWKAELTRTVPLPLADHALASRFVLIQLSGDKIPLYEYATLGGRDNLRGYPWYRFRGKGATMANLEYRFPLIWSFGGVLLLDSGRVYNEAGNFDLGWATDYGCGLRLYLPTMTLRADYSLGNEGGFVTFYYNHAF